MTRSGHGWGPINSYYSRPSSYCYSRWPTYLCKGPMAPCTSNIHGSTAHTQYFTVFSKVFNLKTQKNPGFFAFSSKKVNICSKKMNILFEKMNILIQKFNIKSKKFRKNLTFISKKQTFRSLRSLHFEKIFHITSRTSFASFAHIATFVRFVR